VEKMTILKKGSLNKFGEKVIGETIAYSQRWNVVEVTAPKLREKLIGHEVTFLYKNSMFVRYHKIVNVGRLEYSPYLMLEVEPSEWDIKNHQEAREEVKKKFGKVIKPRPKNFFVKLTDNENLYAYLILDHKHNLMLCDWHAIGEKIYQ
jgi:hypothetical protein